uniref:Uncharacterized protein n=1 Tax=Octopus bimaculoides TaxID=37653 RepID=A0A0L8FNT8_OCTBM
MKLMPKTDIKSFLSDTNIYLENVTDFAPLIFIKKINYFYSICVEGRKNIIILRQSRDALHL